jgi:hypothetical protein
MLRNVCVPPAHLYYHVLLRHSVHHALNNLSQTLVLVERVVHVCRQSDVQSALQALHRHLDVVLMVQDLLQGRPEQRPVTKESLLADVRMLPGEQMRSRRECLVGCRGPSTCTAAVPADHNHRKSHN